VRIYGVPLQWQGYGALEHTLRTGQPATAKVTPAGQWAYLERLTKPAFVV